MDSSRIRRNVCVKSELVVGRPVRESVSGRPCQSNAGWTHARKPVSADTGVRRLVSGRSSDLTPTFGSVDRVSRWSSGVRCRSGIGPASVRLQSSVSPASVHQSSVSPESVQRQYRVSPSVRRQSISSASVRRQSSVSRASVSSVRRARSPSPLTRARRVTSPTTTAAGGWRRTCAAARGAGSCWAR